MCTYRPTDSKKIVLRQILDDNKISIISLAKYLSTDRKNLSRALNGNIDFKLEDLYKIKDYLVDKNIIPRDYDIGSLLDYV